VSYRKNQFPVCALGALDYFALNNAFSANPLEQASGLQPKEVLSALASLS
jgi:hypothetical protein